MYHTLIPGTVHRYPWHDRAGAPTLLGNLIIVVEGLMGRHGSCVEVFFGMCGR